MIIVCEPICWGREHVPVNSGILEIIRRAEPDEIIVFCGERGHVRKVQKQIGSFLDFIEWKTIDLPDRFCPLSKRRRSDYRLIKKLINFLKKIESGHIVLTSTTPFILQVIKMELIFRSRNITCNVVFHGNLSQIDEYQSRNPLNRIQSLRWALLLGRTRRIRYIVLEETIKDALLKLLPQICGMVNVIEHPTSQSRITFENPLFSYPVCFGFLGLADKNKGFMYFLEVAQNIKKKYQNAVEFHAIGQIRDSPKMYDMNCLETKPKKSKLSWEEYTRRLAKLHFICFPYSKDHYELSASGALLDAITMKKPFIAFNIPIFSRLIKKYGNVGYLCNDLNEFHKCVCEILQTMDKGRYIRQTESIIKIQKDRSPESLARKFRMQLNKMRIDLRSQG